MKKEFIFQISKSTAVRSEESVRIPFATSQMLLRVRLEKEYSGMGYLVSYFKLVNLPQYEARNP